MPSHHTEGAPDAEERRLCPAELRTCRPANLETAGHALRDEGPAWYSHERTSSRRSTGARPRSFAIVPSPNSPRARRPRRAPPRARRAPPGGRKGGWEDRATPRAPAEGPRACERSDRGASRISRRSGREVRAARRPAGATPHASGAMRRRVLGVAAVEVCTAPNARRFLARRRHHRTRISRVSADAVAPPPCSSGVSRQPAQREPSASGGLVDRDYTRRKAATSRGVVAVHHVPEPS